MATSKRTIKARVLPMTKPRRCFSSSMARSLERARVVRQHPSAAVPASTATRPWGQLRRWLVRDCCTPFNLRWGWQLGYRR